MLYGILGLAPLATTLAPAVMSASTKVYSQKKKLIYVALGLAIVGGSYYGYKWYKKRKSDKAKDLVGESAYAQQMFDLGSKYGHIFVDGKAILEIAKKVTDWDAVINTFETAYKVKFTDFMRTSLNSEEFIELTTLITKKKANDPTAEAGVVATRTGLFGKTIISKVPMFAYDSATDISNSGALSHTHIPANARLGTATGNVASNGVTVMLEVLRVKKNGNKDSFWVKETAVNAYNVSELLELYKNNPKATKDVDDGYFNHGW